MGLHEETIQRSSASEKSSIRFNRFGATRFARRLAKNSQKPDHDAYLLVLLADQEMIAGRDAEARSLLDAAYAAFDRKINGQQRLQGKRLNPADSVQERRWSANRWE